MIISNSDNSNLTTNEILWKRLKTLISREIIHKDKNGEEVGRYTSIQNFFDVIQDRIENNCEVEFKGDKKKTTVNNANTYNKYLNGTNSMKPYVLREISKELHCSINYLLGITPINSDYVGSVLRLLESNKKIICFWDQIDDDLLHINYFGNEITYTTNELKNKIENLIMAQLFIDSQK